ncbi:hypothetical protein GCM10011581_08070 [Saccharopolyspora subtropica]|uniref:Uncharacterized protein n=1 Tax=Saccharopolyspora thermophila TaxID=89367 RepID=A0A917JNB8_9PSEU|nr:hypothetical protein [Saccharopolyspora subtropica]GGI73489.1 hypothetical protein GCM10011581_08070 [Saccharopolyspora subtropica]
MRRWVRGSLGVLFAFGLVVGGGVASAQGGSGVRDVDWRNAQYTVPPVGPCPEQFVPFTDGAAEVGNWVYRLAPDLPVGYADVTGEGVEDALLFVECGPRNSEYSRALVGVTTGSDARIQPLGTVVSPPVWTQVPNQVTVHDGDIAVRIEDFDTGATWTEHYRWAQSARAFVRVDGQ